MARLGQCRASSVTSGTRSSAALTPIPPIHIRKLRRSRRSRAVNRLIVDGKDIEVPAEYTLLQACEAAGAEIPRFCFHDRLSIAGNCRMCLVELKGSPTPIASCAWAVRDCRPGPKG